MRTGQSSRPRKTTTLKSSTFLLVVWGAFFLAAQTGAQTRIMLLGDSITEGTGSSGGGLLGFRKPLWQTWNGNFQFDFVGSLSHGDGTFDQDHEGHAGWESFQIRDNIGGFLNLSNPEFVLFHIGTNDVSSNRQTQDIIADIDATLNAIWSSNGDSRVFLCAIIPRLDQKDQQTQDLNDAIRNLVSDRASNGDRIHLVDMYARITGVPDWQNALMADNLHTNDAGYALMADEYHREVSPFLNPVVPVELVSFSALYNDHVVELSWSTASESDNLGFNVERRTEQRAFERIGFVPGNGTSAETHVYRFVDDSPATGNSYYRLRQIDGDGSFEFSPEIKVSVSLPIAFALQQNYPNPFNAGTVIPFSLNENAEVTLTVFDNLGRTVAVLLNERREAGEHQISWDGRDLHGEPAASGVYFYQLQTTHGKNAQRLALMR